MALVSNVDVTVEAILCISFGIFLKIAWYFLKRFFSCDLIEGVGFCGVMIHISHCVPTRFRHYCCLPPLLHSVGHKILEVCEALRDRFF